MTFYNYSLYFYQINIRTNFNLYLCLLKHDILQALMTKKQPTSTSNDAIAKHLEERVKELSCLYELSKITQQAERSLGELLTQIALHIPKGFLFPNELLVTLTLDTVNYGKVKTPIGTQLKTTIFVEGRERGLLIIGYPNQTKTSHEYHFLPEEEQLLEKINLEISQLIARREQQEREKILQEKLHKEDRFNVLVELTAGIAHELNTPLGNILGYAELIKKEVPDKIIQSDADKIIRSALNAREIVKKLMYFSCEMPSNFNLLQVNDVIRESVELLKMQLEEAHFDVKLNLDRKLPLMKGDHLQLTQVFLNLILNAISAVKEIPFLSIATTLEEQVIKITVTDKGVGIPMEELNHIFQPFYTTKKAGTGLGLAVVHGIVQAHNGIIFVDTKQEGETRFILTFPYTNTSKK